MKKGLIYLDSESFKDSIDLLKVLELIFEDAEFESYGLSIHSNHEIAKGKFDKLIKVSEDRLFEKDPLVVTDIIEELYEQYEFDAILILATQFGRMLAPRTAMRLKSGLVADVTDINTQDGEPEMIRPAFSGKIMASIMKTGSGPYMMSVRQNVFSYTNENKKATEMINFTPQKIKKSQLNLLKSEEKAISYDIRDSEILISGGGGTIKNFNRLESLAEELNGQVAASRKIIDKGIASRVIQVGQSGKTVSPKLYIALGISGAIQHVEGLKNVENIISINTNRNAPICSISDIVVEGDASEFIDKFVEKVKENKNKI